MDMQTVNTFSKLGVASYTKYGSHTSERARASRVLVTPVLYCEHSIKCLRKSLLFVLKFQVEIFALLGCYTA
jgi:hypothetical protein